MDLSALLATPARVWAERSAREQTLIAIAAGLGLVFLVWTVIMSPAAHYRAGAQAAYEAAVESHRELVSGIVLHRRLAAGGAEAGAGSGGPLGVIIAQSSAERSLAITRVQPDENGQITVWLDSVDAEALMDWLVMLAREEGVAIARATLDREGDGRVRAQIVLGRSAR